MLKMDKCIDCIYKDNLILKFCKEHEEMFLKLMQEAEEQAQKANNQLNKPSDRCTCCPVHGVRYG